MEVVLERTRGPGLLVIICRRKAANYSVLGGSQSCASSDWLLVSLRCSPSGSLLAQLATRSNPFDPKII